VLYFHALRQATGCAEETVEGSPPDVEALLQALFDRHPALRAHGPTLLIARNEEWVGHDAALQADDEVALMPPLSGG
jgi:molybdopterin converting factor small subunit